MGQLPIAIKKKKKNTYWWLQKREEKKKSFQNELSTYIGESGGCRFDSKKVQPHHGIAYGHSRHLKERVLGIH